MTQPYQTGLGIAATVLSMISLPATATGLDTDALFTFFDHQLTKVAASSLPTPPNHDSQWTVGFQPGMFWLMVERDPTGDYGNKYRPVAEAWTTNLINRTPSQVVDGSAFDSYLAAHTLQPAAPDVGFVYFNSFVKGVALINDPTKSAAYTKVALKAAAHHDTYWRDSYSALRSFHTYWPPNRKGPDNMLLDRWEDAVVIDHMAELPLQYWASTTSGHATYAQHATQHGLTTMQRLVRPDGSSYHVIDFHTDPTRDDHDPNTGTLGEKYNLAHPFVGTYQGYWHDSTWSRGQAWGIYGFTAAAAAITPGAARDAHLQTARRMADWFIDHLPADHIPLWDFDALSGRPADFNVNDPNIGLKDASAAAIAASGLLDLALLVDGADDKLRYFTAAEEILLALSQDPYLNLGAATNDGAILLRSVKGYVQDPVYSKVPYADYYFMDAVLKYDRVSAAVPEPAAATLLLLLLAIMCPRPTMTRTTSAMRKATLQSRDATRSRRGTGMI